MHIRLKKVKAIMAQCLIVLSIFCLVLPVTANAQGSNTVVEEEPNAEVQEKDFALIKVIADSSLDNGIILKEGQILYSQSIDENGAIVQVGLSNHQLPSEAYEMAVKEEDSALNMEDLSEYESIQDADDHIFITVPAGVSIYDAETKEEAAVTSETVEYPVSKEDEARYSLILGNKEVFINREDMVLDTSEQDAEEAEETEEAEVETPAPTDTSDDESTQTDVENESDVKVQEEQKEAAEEESEQKDEEEVKASSVNESSNAVTLTAQQTSLTFEQTGFLAAKTPTLTVYDNSSGSLVKVGDIVADQPFQIVSQMGNWMKIKFGQGYGYVWRDSTVPVSGDQIKNKLTYSYTPIYHVHSNVYLSVYDNTSGSLVKMGNIAPQTSYPVLAEVGNWLKIDFSGRVGYIYKPATKVEFNSSHQYLKISDKYLSVYQNEDGNLVKVGALRDGQQYPIEAISGNWIKVKFGNGYGFVWKDSAEPALSHSIKNMNNGLRNTSRVIYSEKYLSVYDNTSGDLVEFGSIDPGVRYPVIERVGNWYKIDFAGRVGYVYEPPTSTNFLAGDQYFEVKEDAVVYDTRSGGNEKVGILTKGQTFKRVEEAGDLHKIYFGDYYGYIQKSGTSVGYASNVQTESNEDKVASSEKTFVALQDVPVFDNGSGSLEQIALIHKNEVYPYRSIAGNWIEVSLGGHIGYVYKTGVQVGAALNNTYYSDTFEQALDTQLTKAPQNDTTRYEAYVHSGAFEKIEGNFGFVKDVWFVRGGPGTNYWKLNASSVVAVNGPLIDGEKVQILGEETIVNGSGAKEKWYQINFYKTYRPDGNGDYKTHYRAFVNASRTDVAHYLNPANFVNDENARFQFLKLSESADASADKINDLMLSNRGNLTGKGKAFVDAGKLHNINEIYLVSHSILETGAGTSRESGLLKGYKINSVNGEKVAEKTVYNVYGIAAYDGCPQSPAVCAAEFAYEEGWFTVEAAIIGGAKFIGEKYIYREGNQQDTLYKMRWNPESPGTHQYATDIGWAVKQAVNFFSSYYAKLGLKPKTFDIPVYDGDPGK
ncbi:hypothetical protein FZC84_13030 [Rossellomorea vietnamensis]|uniref:Mannosyl-glycoprotein endo-beta-N-acetylglucosamidase-like domain-containing protein n=1 Tax=Rossellomorea vietnamensis TaxID=218284 RepID=A0A5D4MBG2_9BACI|nr:N-acetylglucosaminidase [Rossellomorea vietnamensis]TYR98941.1 hypothetical protein FZC84_13030 [Rossellomorea vietnamensis]